MFKKELENENNKNIEDLNKKYNLEELFEILSSSKENEDKK